ncbi:MAG: methionyl-tRNA formyltransferase [Rhodospirillaceae bacterium]|jgi:methionyl-tRNA formyltransferase|nr:methionyl-tRNA formyltransferase [Rhodospirillaceae bacterium]MBT5459669.1 methionyl-tRNA formyltransferase [Rhodospirillaceae bacterium]
MTGLRLVFMGTPDIALPSLAALIDAGHDIACVYSQPPRPAGRGQRERPSPVQAYAEEKGIPVRFPTNLKDKAAQQDFAALGADAAIVIAYGLILPQVVLDAPRLGCLNIHTSLLPRWRGAAPIQRAIMEGDTETGVTIMQMDAGLDTGGILAREAVPITGETTAEALHDALAGIGARLVVETLEGLAAGDLVATPQPDEGATYARKLSRDDGRLDWQRDAEALDRQCRALNPWPGTWFEQGGERIRVLAAEPDSDGANHSPGTVIDDRATIACGSGALRLLRLQRPGKAAMESDAFLRGYALTPGMVLGAPDAPGS